MFDFGFFAQAGVHLLQTEGSKLVMALCQSSYNQGVYGLVTNLGSLVVRTIFFPVEEAAFRAFSKPPGMLCPVLVFLALSAKPAGCRDCRSNLLT